MVQVDIDKALYDEIKRAQKTLQDNQRSKKRVTLKETTKRMGEYLNSLRNSKLY